MSLMPDAEITIPEVDIEKGLSLYCDEMDIYLIALHSYVENVPVTIDKLRNVSEETLPSYCISIHGIKGTSANIGAETMRERALNLEKMAKDGDLEGVLAENEQFIIDMEKMVANIKKYLEYHDSAQET